MAAAIGFGAAVAVPFVYLGQTGNGRTASFLAGILFYVVGRRWQLRNRPWFWLIVAFVALAESPLVIFIHWTSKWIPAAAILPFAIADGIGIFFLIDRISKWMDPPNCHT